MRREIRSNAALHHFTCETTITSWYLVFVAVARCSHAKLHSQLVQIICHKLCYHCELRLELPPNLSPDQLCFDLNGIALRPCFSVAHGIEIATVV